jgi:3-oxoacyl-(acyl-carrier-protein) synthase
VLGAEAAILALLHGVLPPTLHFKERDPDCDLDVVFNQSRKKRVDTVLCKAFAFWGNNSSIIFSRLL